MVLRLDELLDAAIAAQTQAELEEALASLGLSLDDLGVEEPVTPPATRPD